MIGIEDEAYDAIWTRCRFIVTKAISRNVSNQVSFKENLYHPLESFCSDFRTKIFEQFCEDINI